MLHKVPTQPPPRPRRLFDINASPSSPSATVHHSPKILEKNANKDNLTVLTWNIWFDKHKQSIRYKEIVSNVLTLDPDVACFQEVTRPFLNILKSNKDLMKRYYISSNSIYGYGILSIAKKDVFGKVFFEEITLPSNMGRSLLVTHIDVPRLATGGQDKDEDAFHLVVGNVHLESLDNESLRREQLITSSRHLSNEAYSASLLVGDFNFDSEQTWGDWDRSVSLRRHKLENTVLQEVMPEWTDAWPYLKGEGKGKDAADPGITFDGLTNPICVRNKKERMRYDRIMVHMPMSSPSTDPTRGLIHCFIPDDIQMIGVEPIDKAGLKASDHYGLLIKLEIERS